MSDDDETYFFKLFVKDKGTPSRLILEYIRDNIKVINEMRVKIKISKLSQAQMTKSRLETLASKGIVKFPALVTHKNKVKVGNRLIRKYFDNNIKKYQQYLVTAEPPSKEEIYKQDFANDPQLAEFWQSEMSMDALERDRTSNTGEVEGFETMTTENINRRVADQMRGRKISEGGEESFDADQQIAAMHSRGSNVSAPRAQREPANNIASGNPSSPNVTLGGDPDSMFEQAFMQNAGLM